MKVINFIRRFMKRLKDDNISAHASSAAFFLFVSLIPMLLLTCALLPYTPIREATLMKFLVGIFPTNMDSFAIMLIEDIYGKSTGIISITAIVTLWAASKGTFALIRGLNVVNKVEETRNYFWLRAKAGIDTIVFLIMIILSLLIVVFGNVFLKLILKYFPDIVFFRMLFQYLRYIIVWFVLTLLFVLLYVWLPNRRPKIKTQLAGAFFTSTGWIVFSWLFSIYIDNFSSFTMYGSLASIIIILIWLYCCMYIMLMGAEINMVSDGSIKYFFKINS